MFEAAVDDIAEQVTVKRMLAGYGDVAFGGATGPSLMELGKRKDANHKLVSSRIDEDISSDNEMSAIVAQSGCSPPRKRKRISKSIQSLSGEGKNKKQGFSNWQGSDNEIQTSSDKDNGDEREEYTRHVRGSKFVSALNNAKDAQEKGLISLLKECRTEFKGDFQVTSSRNNKDMYNVEISESLSCECDFFAKESSPCKHIIWVMLFVLGVEESSPVLHQLFLTKNELKKILKG